MFSRAVLVMELGADAERMASFVQWVAPALQDVVVLGHLARPWHHWFSSGPWERLSSELSRGDQVMERLEQKLSFVSGRRELEMVYELDVAQVKEAASACDAEVILLGPLPWTTAPLVSRWLEALLKHADRPVLWIGEGASSALNGASPQTLLGAYWHQVSNNRSFISFLQGRSQAFERFVCFDWSDGEAPPEEVIQSWLSMLDVDLSLELFREESRTDVVQQLREEVVRHEADLLVLDAEDILRSWRIPFVSRDTLGALGCPVLLLPVRTPPVETPLEVADCLWSGDAYLSLAVRQPSQLLGQARAPEQIHLLVQGRHRATLPVEQARVLWPLTPADMAHPPGAIGLLRAEEQSRISPDAIEAIARVFRPGSARLLLFDPMLPQAALIRLLQLRDEIELVAVALEPARTLSQTRQSMQEAGLGGCYLLDASQLLDDGDAADLPEELLGMKLTRVAYRLRADGLQVAAIAGRHVHAVSGYGFAVITDAQLLSIHPGEDEEVDPGTAALVEEIDELYMPVDGRASSLEQRLERLTMARAIPGNAVALELDNQLAREQLLQRCREAQRRVHIQSYIVKDDPFSQQLADALEQAAERGVKVRILLDSLYSLHGSFGQVNPWVERLQQHEAIEIRCFRPIEGFPNIEDLKQRNHRKLILFDGEGGVVTGRNLARSYYTSYDEVEISASTPGEDIPWVDAGVFVQGPVVRTLEASFLRDWETAGGEPFALIDVEECGTVPCRFVRHDGLADAFTMESQLALIRAAKSHLYIVNTFPLQEEFGHALLQAIKRGVKVRLLIGNVRPLFGEAREPFSDSLLRDLATAVIHGRIDRLVEAGGEAFEYIIDEREGWPPALLPVRPHVHSKLLTCDGLYTAIGSANLDVTGGFWESEGLLLIHDVTLTQEIEAELHASMKEAGRIDPDDDAWKQRAQRRAWISHSWPNILS